MITITYGKLIGIIIALCLIIYTIIVIIKEYLEAKLEELKEKEEELDRRFDNWKEKQETFWKVYYERKLEWYKHDQEVKKQPEYHRVTFKLYGKGNESLSIDCEPCNCELRNDGFWKIKDKDENIILINSRYVKEARRNNEAGNTRGSSEDDKG